jgi:hypothetical protein
MIVFIFLVFMTFMISFLFLTRYFSSLFVYLGALVGFE